MKMCKGLEGIIPLFLTSALAGGEWSASRPGRFTSGEEPPVPIGGGKVKFHRGNEILFISMG
jgi:hypothetical protein